MEINLFAFCESLLVTQKKKYSSYSHAIVTSLARNIIEVKKSAPELEGKKGKSRKKE